MYLLGSGCGAPAVGSILVGSENWMKFQRSRLRRMLFCAKGLLMQGWCEMREDVAINIKFCWSKETLCVGRFFFFPCWEQNNNTLAESRRASSSNASIRKTSMLHMFRKIHSTAHGLFVSIARQFIIYAKRVINITTKLPNPNTCFSISTRLTQRR